MTSDSICFNRFKTPVDFFNLPETFTYPFFYQPHPLCIAAAEELQLHLQTQQEWQHNFGLPDSNLEGPVIGKMFGVLLVKNKDNELGYLAAFSGKLADSNHLPYFVPPVYDALDPGGFFTRQKSTIDNINQQIIELEKNPLIAELQQQLQSATEESVQIIKQHRELMIENRKARKQRRTTADTHLSAAELLQLNTLINNESIADKNRLRDLKQESDQRIQHFIDKLTPFTEQISSLKQQRKELSASLQKQIFEQYQFLNISGARKSLLDIFHNTPNQKPPAAAGECAAPKLLQYAFLNNMTPLAMAEFWWGASPKSEIRKHQHYYGACIGKCKPILAHMLDGMNVDEDPLLINPASDKDISIIYEDTELLVINKPADMLSVPGKNIEDSVYNRIRQRYPNATSPLIVHRLDMATSGLLLIALTKEAHKNLQNQFIKRTVKKRYIALLDGIINEDSGIIDLPIRVDLDDRPRQLVCYVHGKPARTKWQVIDRTNGKTRVYFYPVTGRTHQLRVHAAHHDGLNTPIIGDDLYGISADRLHLHAERIEFNHPSTGEHLCFAVNPDF